MIDVSDDRLQKTEKTENQKKIAQNIFLNFCQSVFPVCLTTSDNPFSGLMI